MPSNTTTTAAPRAKYRAVSRQAVLSLVVGALAGLTALSWWFVPIPIAAIVLGWRALRQMGRTPEELTGEGLAWSGIGLAIAFWSLGSGWLMFARASEVPYGYQRVDYADLQPDPKVPDERVPPAATKLDDKKVFIKGYMVPGRQRFRMKQFFVCPTNGVCEYHFPNPKPTEIIRVKLTGDLTADYTTRLIGLGGRFHVDPEDPNGVPYSMEGDRLQ